MTLRVGTALTDAAQESRVVQALSGLSDVALARRCRDLVELRAVAHAAHVDVVVVDDTLRGLDREVVGGLTALGVRVVVVGDDPSYGVGIGAQWAVGRDLVGLADALRRPLGAGTAPPPQAMPDPPSGHLVAVWGPQGAPGRTTVAVELAGSLTRGGHDVLLVDADTVGPSVAQLLGVLDDTSGLAAAARLAVRRRLETADVAALAVGIPLGPRVLVGLPGPERWPELRPTAMAEVLRCAREVAPWTVVDVGAPLEGDDLEWVDPDRPQRFGAARQSLAAADVVVCVGRTDPVGLSRLLRDVPRVRDLAPTAEVVVVLNRVCSAGEFRSANGLVEDVLRVSAQHLLPDERQVQRAQARGVMVHDLAPASPWVRTVDVLASQLASAQPSYDRGHGPAARTHRGLLRRPHRRHRSRDAGVV